MSVRPFFNVNIDSFLKFMIYLIFSILNLVKFTRSFIFGNVSLKYCKFYIATFFNYLTCVKKNRNFYLLVINLCLNFQHLKSMLKTNKTSRKFGFIKHKAARHLLTPGTKINLIGLETAHKSLHTFQYFGLLNCSVFVIFSF